MSTGNARLGLPGTPELQAFGALCWRDNAKYTALARADATQDIEVSHHFPSNPLSNDGQCLCQCACASNGRVYIEKVAL